MKEQAMSDFLSRLQGAGVLIADGAMGTMLQQAGLPRRVPPERWNLENPAAVREVGQSYVEAGAQLILTNTFGGSRIRLEKNQLGDRVEEINRVAAGLAREAAEGQALVLGDMGPTGELLKPVGPLEYAQAVEAFAEQAAALAEGGVAALLIETMSDLKEALAAVEGARSATSLPVLVTFSFDTHGRTMMGLKPAQAAKDIWALGVAAVGANCGRTLSETLTAIQAMRQAVPEATLMAKPNAGLPRVEGENELVYDVTPAEMADYALKFSAEGVKIFGGCCGSTPAHIRAVAQALAR
jgi:5-methyltetrahydrofolate--homocysteine methyltransferase